MSGRHRYPFTATQWEELEHQALIFKYIVSGIPVPAHLLYTLQTSCCSFNTPPPPPPPQQQHMIGWNGFQMGLGKKVDPEPGRCRRTDGKKWRCSKEAHPDSKYCERHMHRGKNRSRKPVEFPLITPLPNAKSGSSNFDDQPSGKMMMRRFHGNLLPMEGSGPQLSVGGGHDHHYSYSSAGSSISSSSSSSCSSWRVQKQKHSDHDDHDHDQWPAAGDHCKAQEEEIRTVHRFFDEGPPPANKNQLQDQQQHPWQQQPSREDRSTTKLSISIPSSTR